MMIFHTRSVLSGFALVAFALVLTLITTPAAAAPNIQFNQEVRLESTLSYTVGGAMTLHEFLNPAPPTGPGLIRLDVDGDFGSSHEFAELRIEGDVLGNVGQNVGSDCLPDSGTFNINLEDLTAYALDGITEVEVDNSSTVGVVCANNYHQVTLTYPAAGDHVDFGAVAVGVSVELVARVENTGDFLLDITSIVSDSPEFTATPASLVVPPASSAEVILTFTPPADEAYAGTLTVLSNDPVESVLTVDLTGAGFFPPEISVDPATIDASLVIGTSTTEVLTITNGNPGELHYSISSNRTWLSTSPVSGTVPALDYQHVDVIIDASDLAVGPYSGWLDISSNDTATPNVYVQVFLIVLPAPDIDVDPAPATGLVYGPVELGASRAQLVTIYNLSSGTLHVGSITSDSAEFVPSINSAVVPPGGSAQFPVVFTPPQTGLFSGTLSIASDDPDEPLIALPMSGEGVPPPSIGLSPVGFEVTALAGATEIETLVVSNAGPGTLAFDLTEYASWLDVVPVTGLVPPTGSAHVNVEFNARTLMPGVYNADLTVASNDPAQPVLSVPVSMTVVLSPDINVGRAVSLTSVQPFSVSGATTQHEFTIDRIPNEGGTIELIAEGDFGGPTETALLLAEGLALGTVGGAGAGCDTVSDSFRLNDADLASLVVDGIFESLVVNTPDVGATCPINSHTLRVRYLEQVDGLNFGAVPIGGAVELTLQLENSGTQPLHVGPLTTDVAEFSVRPTSFTLDPGATDTITVIFQPMVVAPFSATLGIPSNDPDEPRVTLGLTGNGTQPGTIGVAPLSMASTLQAGEQETQILSISNTGVADLEFSVSAVWTSVPVSPTAVFLHFEPHQGTLLPSGLEEVDVTFSTIGLPAGVHEVEISVVSNDVLDPVVTLPASLTVTSAPHIQIAGELVALHSIANYDTAGAVTAHSMIVAGTPVGAGFVVLQAMGDYERPEQTATLSAEGIELGAAGGGGFACSTAHAGFAVETTVLAGMAANGLFSFEVANSEEVQPDCPINRHALTLNYWPEVVSLGFGSVDLGGSRTLPLRIASTGTELLEVTSITSDTPEYTVSMSSVSLQPGESVTLDVTLTPSAQENFNGVLEIVSNDPEHPLIQIPLSGGGSCVDDDEDGLSTCDGDCDDSNPFCGLNCADLDADSYCADFDCDDLVDACNLECIDSDADGLAVCAGDCDDANPSCTTDCTDADSDGVCVTLDCDDHNAFCDFDCTDADSDGYCVTSDCDESSPGCNSDCSDVDADGLRACDGDCDDTNANCTTNCTDVDGDGYCVTTDCYDLNANCTTDCTDADEDGYCVTTDCDETNANCTSDCTDLDADGYCVTTDCHEANPNCTTDCTDVDGDGYCVNLDCDDTNPGCTSDCTDADDDGYCLNDDCDEGNPNCTSDCTDADADGYCITSDCDDTTPNCTTDCTDADADGYCITSDCDESQAHCTSDCTDADGDGYCVTDDCDEDNPNCTSDCTDADADGYCVPEDCNDTVPECNEDCTDLDDDGYCGEADCDEANPFCTSDCTDADGDQYCVTVDCDDGKPNCTTDCTDDDADGYCGAHDCDDTTFDCNTDCADADGDGVRMCDGDCDDEREFCTTDCTDADDDGYCVPLDCDDGKPYCTTDCTDADDDGHCPPEDCDDTDPDCTSGGCDDLDGDGVRVCNGDCIDDDPYTYPGATELCTDHNDNDCDGLSDEQDTPCDGLNVVSLHFAHDDKASLTWDVAAAADWYGLYRGPIGESGFGAYRHLCEAAQVTGTTAEDPDLPPPGEGYYYLVTGQLVDAGDGGRWVGGPLGRSARGFSRPDSSSIACGPRVYVDPDLAADGDGLSWATAYTGVGSALLHAEAPERGVEVWARGSLSRTGGTVDQATRAGARLLGGFSGTESFSWERDPVSSPTVWEVPGSSELLRVVGLSFVLDGLELVGSVDGVIFAPAGEWTEVVGVSFGQVGGWGLDLTSSAPARLVLEGNDFGGSGFGCLRAIAEAGALSGRVRRNTFDGGSYTALFLEAAPRTTSSAIELDVVANVIRGGGHGIMLGAYLDDRAVEARQSSFVASNLIYGTEGIPIIVSAYGQFNTLVDPATVLSEPLVIGNTLTDGADSGLAVSASRSDFTTNAEAHIVRAAPQIWDNLITFNAGPGIVEVQDDPAVGVSCDPAAVVGNDLYGNQFLYLDEGSAALTSVAEVNFLPGAADNFDEPPGYVDRAGGDYHLSIGTVLGYGSAMRHLTNVADPGLGLSWTTPTFDDSGWESGVYGVGYDTGPPPNAENLLPTVVPPGAYSVFTRTTFTVDDLSEVIALKFGADFDDGCVAWLNGVELYRSPSMPAGDPTWDAAPGAHESSNAQGPVYQLHDVSAAALMNGINVLAVGVWNETPVSDDLVLVPLLIINQEVAPVDAGHIDAPRLAREDLDGEARVADGNRDGKARPDVGADER